MRTLYGIARAAILAAILFTSSMVWAVPPDRAVYVLPFVFTLPCEGYAFDLTMKMTVTSEHTYFYDQDGVWIRWLVHNSADVELLRSDEVGESLYGSRGETQIVDPTDFSGVVNGPMIRIVVPGYGPLLFEVGRTQVDANGNLYFQGFHHDWLGGDFADACAYFAGF